MPRVLHAVTSGGIDGALRSVVALAREQRELGWDPVVLTARHGFAAEACARAGVPVLVEPAFLPAESKDATRRQRIEECADACLRVVAAARPDVLHTHLPSAGLRIGHLLARRLRLPLVQTHHSIRLHPADREVMTGTGLQVIVVAEAARALLTGHGVPAERVACIPNGVPDPPPIPYRLPRTGRHLVFVGRLAPEKGLDTALEAMALLAGRPGSDRPTLHVFGDGPEARRYRSRVRGYGPAGAVAFHGVVPGIVHPGLGAAALLAPSRREACPLTILEAMASRIPVVAGAVGEVPTMVPHRVGGLLVTPDDPEQLADAVAQLMEEPDVAAAYARNARHRYETTYTMPPMARRTVEVYRRMLERRPTTTPRRTGECR
ncbi:glycosyltransferase family 4 protein [Kitasatospora sp. NPDC058444]|uniref:glycosyltransferase family 4 protein n=1 Tax=Kitasatospora sp. NPDC058444 TaxID=3346504 RepID=UPI003668CDC5